MRVLHWYPKFLGGGAVANAVRLLARAQAARGAQVAVAARRLPGGTLYGEGLDGVAVTTWAPVRPALARMSARGVVEADRAALAAFAPDVVHVHGELNPDNLVAARLFTGPLVLSPHGGFHPLVLARGRRRVKALYLALAKRVLYRRATLHAASPLEAEDIAALLPDRPVYCAPQGPGCVPPAPVPDAHGGDTAVRLLFIGRLNVAEKGLDLLLDALAAARAGSMRPLRLTIVGPDWDGGLATLRRRIADLRLVDEVELTGTLPPDGVTARLAAADCYVQLSRNEGFGLSVAEALLAGLPALLSDRIGAAAFPEVRAHPHVRTVPPSVPAAAAALIDLLPHLSALRAQARAALPALRDFLSWDRAAAIHLARYGGAEEPAPAAAGA